MNRYLFVFGYQTRDLWDTDDEDSQAVWIEAPDREAALAWGVEVAERFIAESFPSLPSWKSSRFAFGIEEPGDSGSAPTLSCRVGEFPDWKSSR